ncbi:MAG: rhomboid family intramembrane serine protease [Bacteroidia bacterium]
MNKIANDLQNFFRYGTVVQKFIIVNAAVFIVINIISLILFLSQSGFNAANAILPWLAVPADLKELAYHPWTLLTYMFTHKGLFHIFFNMLLLYWGGLIFLEYLGTRKLVATYFLGGIAGAIMYIAVFNLLPVFSDYAIQSRAIGASASVLAIFIAIATYLPNYTVNLMFFGPTRLKYIAIVMVLIDLLSIEGGNAGGHIAHIGGALYGFVFSKQLQKGRDIGSWFNTLLDSLANLNKPKSKLKVAHKNVHNAQPSKKDKAEIQKRIDAILDKISQSGYESLSKEEKEMLFNYSKDV